MLFYQGDIHSQTWQLKTKKTKRLVHFLEEKPKENTFQPIRKRENKEFEMNKFENIFPMQFALNSEKIL